LDTTWQRAVCGEFFEEICEQSANRAKGTLLAMIDGQTSAFGAAKLLAEMLSQQSKKIEEILYNLQPESRQGF
jgi:hypothetical protein